MSVVLIDYGAGNLHSVAKAFRHVGGDRTITISNKPDEVRAASHVVLPGVGAFASCMAGLKAVPGMLDAISEFAREKQRPFLGICVGMQMLLEEGHEHGVHQGLGWIKGVVEPIKPTDTSLKIPHMGWNDLQITKPHAVLNGIATGDHAYFVHSYHARCADAADVMLTTEYGGAITAAIARDNLIGTQFHPEKSQKTGLQLLQNFLEM